MSNLLRIILLSVLVVPVFNSCMDYGPVEEEDFDFSVLGDGVFIVNEGNFMFGNATLSYYIPSENRVENEVFSRSNGISLGDVAQSMVVRDGLGYIVVNNSGIIFVIDIATIKVTGIIGAFTSPRYIHFVSDTKAYITQLWDSRIAVVNPATRLVEGYIETPMQSGAESTEQMVQYDKYVFVSCWSYNDRILVIDTDTDEVVDEIEVGIQPASMVIDKNNKIWTICDGGYEGSPYGYTSPSLYRIDAATRTIEQQFEFPLGDLPSEVCLNGTRDTLYFINRDIWRMDVTDSNLPVSPFIAHQGTTFYGLAVDPVTSEVYVADAIDCIQSGVVYRYSSEGELLDDFRVGVNPAAFCFTSEQ